VVLKEVKAETRLPIGAPLPRAAPGPRKQK
jgi:hypothetical protein